MSPPSMYVACTQAVLELMKCDWPAGLDQAGAVGGAQAQGEAEQHDARARQ